MGVLALAAALALAACAPNLGAATRGWSPVVAGDGVVYVVTRNGDVKALVDGGFEGVRLKWTFSGPGDAVRGAYGPPALGDDLIYVSAVDGHLYALDKETGTLGERGWRAPQGEVPGLRPLVGGPALDAQRGIVVVGSEDHNLYAYDARTGNELWRFAAGDKIWSTPVIHGGTVYFGSHDHNVYAVDTASGQERWRFATDAVVVATPLVWRDLVIIGSFDRRLYAIDANTGGLRWEFQSGNWFWAGAAASTDTVYAPSMDGNVYALNQRGNLLWTGAMGSPVVSTPVLVQRGLVVASLEGRISVLNSGTGEPVTTPLSLDPALIKAPLYAVAPGDGTPGQTATGTMGGAQRDSVFASTQESEVRRIQVTAAQVQVWCFDAQRDEICN